MRGQTDTVRKRALRHVFCLVVRKERKKHLYHEVSIYENTNNVLVNLLLNGHQGFGFALVFVGQTEGY